MRGLDHGRATEGAELDVDVDVDIGSVCGSAGLGGSCDAAVASRMLKCCWPMPCLGRPLQLVGPAGGWPVCTTCEERGEDDDVTCARLRRVLLCARRCVVPHDCAWCGRRDGRGSRHVPYRTVLYGTVRDCAVLCCDWLTVMRVRGLPFARGPGPPSPHQLRTTVYARRRSAARWTVLQSIAADCQPASHS